MATVESADGRLKVMTWNWPHEDRTSSYGGLVAFGMMLTPEWTSPDSMTQAVPTVRTRTGSSSRKTGAAPCTTEWSRTPWIPMSGSCWAGMTPTLRSPEKSSSRSRCGPKGPRFGAGVLQSPQGLRRRHVLEYADAVQASLRHQPEARGKQGHPERILFDHLARANRT